MRKAVLDRFEEQMAVFVLDDTGEVIAFPRQKLMLRLSEGDWVVLSMEGDAILDIRVDEEATLAAKQRIKEKLERLRRGDHLKKNEGADK